MTAMWRIVRDPVRPNWPGVLVVSDEDGAVIHVEAGRPVNFADSHTLAKRIAEALIIGGVPAIEGAKP